MKTFFLASAAVLVVIITILQITAQPPSSGAAVELTWATDDNPTRTEQMALFRSWYKETYGTTIGIHIDPSNYDQGKIVVQSVAGSGPDLFDYYGPTNLQSYVESGILLDITEAALKGGFSTDHFWPAMKTTIAMDGRQYAVPDNAVGSLLLVQADLLDQLHLSPPSPGWTWADLLKLGQALTARDAQGRVTRFGILSLNWTDLVLQNGGEFFNANGTRCTLNTPEVVEALQFYSDLQVKYHVLASMGDMASMSGAGGYGGGSTAGDPNYLNIFVAGKGAMLTYGRYGYIVINRVNDERKTEGLPPLRIIPLPPLTEKRTALVMSGRCTGINRRGAHLTEATRFLEFLSTKTFNDQINRSADSLPGSPQYATNPDMLTGGRPLVPGCDDQAWIAGMQQGVAAASTRFCSGTVLNRILKEEMDRLDSALQTPAETAQRMEQRINIAIGVYLKVRPDLKQQWQALESAPAVEKSP